MGMGVVMSRVSSIGRMASSVALATALGTAAFSAVSPAAAQSPTVVVSALPPPAAGDPLERSNRRLFAFNEVLDRRVVRPAAVFVHHALPRPVRVATGNFLRNLGEPVVALNDGLQGRPGPAGEAVARFVMNSTVGVGGLADVATGAGAPHHDNGFALTLGRWGVGPGAYLYAPVLGPSTVRDSIGSVMDLATNPFGYVGLPAAATLAPGVTSGLETRARLDPDLKSLHAVSTDPYATLRSFYLQSQAAKVAGGRLDVENLPDFGDPDEPATVAESAPAGAGGAKPTVQAAAARGTVGE